MIRLEPVTEATFRDVIRLKVAPGQEGTVASNVYSLAQAWLYPEARPFAILEDDTVVGFVMLDWDEAERDAGIWRFMIGEAYQKRGYGRAALRLLIGKLKDTGLFDVIDLDYVEGNDVARDLYRSLGFRENGEVEDGEIVMTLRITDQPKVALVQADREDLDQLEGILDREGRGGFPDRRFLEDALEKGKLGRFTLYGETIGVSAGGVYSFRRGFDAYRQEAIALAGGKK